MKHQALFSFLKDESKKIKMLSAAVLLNSENLMSDNVDETVSIIFDVAPLVWTCGTLQRCSQDSL